MRLQVWFTQIMRLIWLKWYVIIMAYISWKKNCLSNKKSYATLNGDSFVSRCTSVMHNSCHSVLYLFITTWQKTKKSHWWILQLRRIFGRTEKKWRWQVRDRTAWTALEMQIICIPVFQCEKKEPTYICEQSLLFLLIGRAFLSSEEKTGKKPPTNQA